MPSALLPLVLLVTWCAPGAESSKPRDAPIYSAASIVNAADNQSGALAPNTIGTIYGKNLAYNTAALTADEVHGGILPTVLTGSAEVRVFINHYPADLYYVSPTQINFLVPPDLLPQPALFQVVIDGQYGTSPPIQFTLAAAAPALFQLDLKNAVATRARPAWRNRGTVGDWTRPDRAAGRKKPTAYCGRAASGGRQSFRASGRSPRGFERHLVCGYRARLRRSISN
jgi:hypothetical protein